MIAGTGVNESKTLTRLMSCKYKCRFYGKNVLQINGEITIKVYVSVKSVMYVKRLFWNPSTCSYENGKYLAITCKL